MTCRFKDLSKCAKRKQETLEICVCAGGGGGGGGLLVFSVSIF